MPPCPSLLAVVMPVYNAGGYLDEAIASILAQSFADFRFVIYDDCSTDGSFERALHWASTDRRIAVVRGERRLGPQGSSSAAAALADTIFVARMDADDIAAEDRLERQLAVLDAHPAAVLVGTAYEMIDADGRTIGVATRKPRADEEAPFAHPSIMYRNAAFVAAGGYRRQTDYFEDADLYRRMEEQGEILVIDRCLIRMRFAGQHARLKDDASAVLESLDKLYSGGERAGQRLDPIAFFSIASLSIKALRRPRLLGMMARRMRFSRPGTALAVTSIVALGEVSPAAARTLLAWGSRLRRWRGQPQVAPEEVYRWRPRVALQEQHGRAR